MSGCAVDGIMTLVFDGLMIRVASLDHFYFISNLFIKYKLFYFLDELKKDLTSYTITAAEHCRVIKKFKQL